MAEKKERDGEMCGCPMCWGSHHWGHILVKVAIILFVFWCGVQFGELKNYLRMQYEGMGYMHRSMMMENDGMVMGGTMTLPLPPLPKATSTPAKR